MDPSYDAIVIGGGPAGSTFSALFARGGRRVLVLEKEKFPRFHVGESLLPYGLPVLERLGALEKVRRAGFQEKYGAFIWNEDKESTRPVVFAQANDDKHPMAYQVKRAEFDDLLLRHAEELGAEVREEASVREVLFENGRAVGVSVKPAAGEPYEVRARVIVDASGQTAFLAQKLGTRRFDPKLKRAALFAHYENVPRPEGRAAGDILLPVEDEVWYWIIPFSDGTSSVGAVFDPKKTDAGAPAGEKETPEGKLERLLNRSARMKSLMGAGRRTSKVHGIADYSASSHEFAGNGWVMIGDAATFLDPVFSTGVFLAMSMGERAAADVERALARRGQVDAGDLRGYSRFARRLVRRFRKFVDAFYDPVFFEAFCGEAPFDKIRASVTSILAGGVEKVPPLSKLWIGLMFFGVGFDRFRRRIGLGPKPDESAAA